MTRRIDEIGAGLAPARRGVPFTLPLRIHVVGVGGTAATAAALHAAALGVQVTGYDRELSLASARLLATAGVQISAEGDLDSVRSANVVAVSKAITSTQPDHPQLQAARAAGLPLISLQQVIADAAATRGGPLLGVAGTHGKTTSTGWLLAALRASGRDPSAFVGGPLPEGEGSPTGAPVHLGSEPGFIVEADEYGGNFDPYVADAALILNADWDHPDVFEDRAAVVRTFASWAAPVLTRGPLVINVTDVGGSEVAAALEEHNRESLLTYVVRSQRHAETGPSKHADAVAELVEAGEGRVALRNLTLSARAVRLAPAAAELVGTDIPIGLLGAHNAANALGVALFAAAAGGSSEGIRSALANFPGVGRRMEVRYDRGGITILDDYGHHPTAIDATISTVRLRYPGRPLVLAIEPLTYHRTAALLAPIARSCAAADRVLVADIFAIRDTDLSITSAAALAAAVARHGVVAEAPGSVEATADRIADSVPPGAVVLVMGGGRSTDLATRLARTLEAR
ncbi:MAG: glutamate ligase domain-containing protein [Candidatus Limnocylindrus sp.]